VCRLDGFIDPALLGATHALLAEIVRRTRAELPLRIRKALPARGSHFALEAVVTLDGMPFDARLWLDASDRPSSGVPARSLHELGSLPVSLTLVAALSLAKRDELAELEPGDAWLPGEGWLCDARGHGTLILVGAAGLDGASARLSESGELVLVGARMSLAPDGEQTMAEIDQAESGALANAVLDAPVVVRVEVGAVTLSAREWAELRPGDVIETGRRIADVVSLRVGGREVARGELVNVEGQLGVRIRELSTDDGGP
jgi:type III secretion system YscQ/HrcQ family protein